LSFRNTTRINHENDKLAPVPALPPRKCVRRPHNHTLPQNPDFWR